MGTELKYKNELICDCSKHDSKESLHMYRIRSISQEKMYVDAIKDTDYLT